MKSELLQIEVELLLVKYGEAAVLKALATAADVNEAILIEKIKSLQKAKTRPTARRAQKQLIDVAKAVTEGSPNEDLLDKLAVLYQNKQFLPQLKDVKKFLGRFNMVRNIKNRNDATKIVFESLKKCSRDELAGFISDLDVGKQSSFATLAEHIMGSHGGKSSK